MTVKFEINRAELDNAIEYALAWATFIAVDEISKITPRDKERMPQNINRKDWLEPHRNTHFKPVNIGWNWYMWVSWALARSIWFQKMSWDKMKIWVIKWSTLNYAAAQEFWVPGHIPERSYLRKWLFDNEKKIKATFIWLLKQRLWKI